MTEMMAQEPIIAWGSRWRVARATVMTSLSWILTLPLLARLMHWPRRTATTVQNILGPISGLVWGRIGWVGVRKYDFSNEDAFLAGGLAGAAAPTIELTLRRLGWPPGPETDETLQLEPLPMNAYPFALLWGFLFGGLLATLGAIVARIGRD
jgi:hypothetical protein